MSASSDTIVLAGATGRLGGMIAAELSRRSVGVRALVRPNSDTGRLDSLSALGVEVVPVNFDDAEAVAAACRDASCVVSAVAGLRDVIVDLQTTLLDAAVAAGVPRFIPSDYCIDYTRLTPGNNRNLDVRREFRKRLDDAPISGTSVLCGMFAELLTGQAPVVLFDRKRVFHWGNADQLMDFTTMPNTAEFTAMTAIEHVTPRFVRIAGDSVSMRGLAAIATELTGQEFKLLRPGGLGAFNVIIAIMRKLMPAKDDLYPPWQGMQYLRDMLSGEGKLEPLDNQRHPQVRWMSVKEVLAEHLAERPVM